MRRMRLAADAATRRHGRQFLLGHADFLAERFGVGLGGLHTLGQIADLLLAASVLASACRVAVLIVDEERRRAGVGDAKTMRIHLPALLCGSG